MIDLRALCDDLAAEQRALDDLVDPLDDAAWATTTPATGWDVRDCISHLCYFDETADLAVNDTEKFAAHAEALIASFGERDDDVALGRALTPPDLLARWRESRAALLVSLEGLDPSTRVPWYGPAMSAASFTTARIMETWAHGQDVVDALEAPPIVSDRLRHICHIGVGARGYSYLVNGVDDPGDPVRVEVVAPSGGTWTWGPDSATDTVTGTALDFALVVTHRRNIGDTELVAKGPVAQQWIGLAQSFAGPAGPGRAPGLRKLQQ